MSEAHTLGALIRQHRLAASLSQAVLAERAQLSVATIAALERGRSSRPRPATVLLLAEALGLSPRAQAALIHAANGGGRPEGGQITSAPVAPAPIGLDHNLPRALTDFVGRDRDLAEVERALSEMRLVTLTGPGGVGKTRLAVEAASRLARRPSGYTGGIWRVELAPLTDGVQVPRAVASTLGIQELPGQPVLESVIGWLRGRQALLVLDNCEHLLAPCATTISAVLETCPDVTILTNSREALNVTGEVVWRVGPLQAESAGLQMFVSLATRASPEFQLTSEVRSAVIRVCKRLDGLRLAIELAAARVNALSVEEIENRLDQHFVLFNTGRRTSPPRHRTLRALVDWSYDLLPADEQRLFQQLSVFSGGWTLDAAEAVCEAGLDVLPRPRRGSGLSGPEHQEWLQRLEAEVDNFRAALRWSLDEPAGRDAGLRLAASLVRFWFLDGGTAEVSGSRHCSSDHREAPRGLTRSVRVASYSCDEATRVRRAPAGGSGRRGTAAGRQLAIGSTTDHLGELLVQEGDLAGARRALEESLELNVDGADRTVFWPRTSRGITSVKWRRTRATPTRRLHFTSAASSSPVHGTMDFARCRSACLVS